MGGTQAAFESNQQYEQASKDLNEVKYFIDFPPSGNHALIDISLLHKSLSEEVDKYLTINGILHKDVGQVGRGGGGGGLETLRDILNTLLQTKNIIMFLVSIYGFAKIAISNYLNNSTKNLKPRICAVFWIETQTSLERLTDGELNSLLIERLANLLLVSVSIGNIIEREHKHLCYDFSIEARVSRKNYNVTFSVPYERNSKHNISRLLKIISNLEFKKNYSAYHDFTKWHAIKRFDRYQNGKTGDHYILLP